MDKDIPATGEAKPSGRPAPSNDGPKRKQTQNQQQRRRAFNKPAVTMLHFEGKCEGLKGHTYDVSDPRQAADVYQDYEGDRGVRRSDVQVPVRGGHEDSDRRTDAANFRRADRPGRRRNKDTSENLGETGG
jgi:hypothetical protein